MNGINVYNGCDKDKVRKNEPRDKHDGKGDSRNGSNGLDTNSCIRSAISRDMVLIPRTYMPLFDGAEGTSSGNLLINGTIVDRVKRMPELNDGGVIASDRSSRSIRQGT